VLQGRVRLEGKRVALEGVGEDDLAMLSA
jgi:hypothetical protein